MKRRPLTRRRTLLGATGSLVALAGCVFTDGEVEFDRGELAVVVDGEAVDLSADRFQAENVDNDSVAFHLHKRDEYWYMEGEEPVTFAEGIDLLPRFAYANREGAHVVTVDGSEYDGRDSSTAITFLVDGESVDPMTYEVRDGDSLRLEITTDA